MKIVKENDQYTILSKKIQFFSTIENVVSDDVIYLSDTLGESMSYGLAKKNFIDYPGEYDIKGLFIKAFQASGSLSYHIDTGTKHIGLLTHKKSIDDISLEVMDQWIVTDEKLVSVLEKREVDGEIQLLQEFM